MNDSSFSKDGHKNFDNNMKFNLSQSEIIANSSNLNNTSLPFFSEKIY